MKPLNSIHALLAALAVLLIAFYTIDLQPLNNKASVFNLPDFTSTTDVKPSDQQPVNTLQDLNDAIVNITEKTTPTVVTVFTTQTVTRQNPFSRFFNFPGEDDTQKFQRSGLGSGVIVSQDGYILTNNHVVEGADEIRVRTFEGNELNAEIVGTDPQTDVAVLKIDAKNLPAIELGTSDNVRVGEFVLAIGSPFGGNLAHSVSFGIVSGKGRAIGLAQQTGGYENFIQTDAAINPGNSGGALINLDGELIGINTAIASRSGGNQGIGFAIPVDMAKNIMTQLIETGEVTRAYLGIFGQTLDATMAEALGIDQTQGVLINTVEEGTPAEEAGLQEGDVIIAMNGKRVKTYYAFRTDVAGKKPGTKVTLDIIRDGEQQKIEVSLGELPGDQTASSNDSSGGGDLEDNLGFAVQNVTPEIARQLKLSRNTKGVVVTNISRGSDAYRQGLRQGDVIVSIARQRIEDVGDFNNIMNELVEEGNQAVLLRVIRQGIGLFIAFEL